MARDGRECAAYRALLQRRCVPIESGTAQRVKFSIAAPPLQSPQAHPLMTPRRLTFVLHRAALRWAAGLGLAASFVLAPLAARADAVAEINTLLARGDPNAALQRAERASIADPRDVQVRFLHALVLMDLQRNREAMTRFTALSQDFPELADPYNNLALLHVRAKELQQARAALEMALRNDPSHRTARANLGQVHLMLAVQAWEQVANTGALDAQQQRQLDAARALLTASPR